MGRQNGKVSLITGAGSGMGKAAAILFAKEGAKVVVVDIATEKGDETVRTIKTVGAEAIFVHADVSKAKDVKKMIKATLDTYGKLDILYNNAGIIVETLPIGEATEEAFDKTIDVNLKSVFLGMRYAIPEMMKSGGGVIINKGSQVADRALAGIPSYAASKGGIEALSRNAAIEYAKHSIRINCINPGTIATPLVLSMSEEAKRRTLDVIPIGRFGQPEEVAYLALFLASDEASYITGQAIIIDGGLTMDSRQTCSS
jgi:NAD(P)-dependent dehydrogenase (short-subunit alcohol dehydrogenase family)